MATEVEWEDRFGRLGKITIDDVGLRVTAGRGFRSPDLTDTAELRKIFFALGDVLVARKERDIAEEASQ